ncbi:MAG: 2-(1,2-epoxy-1,2-dihydrophenyl)acetyl-CoA isomerase [Flavobacteriales bacterium]|jgi:2-(1,2-epoxy-1,2-dihydrophenyl)acetyl-CoA isomerase|nr:2-(1,2-epoxy-1,2-dihydrophenyl)acetyl-CoA isomerase [Flavobacteriales bacterium]MBK6551693.1 2-(1,2-epoxy-1,2-dihydrophenyl)acetyl-CoA isomerase [Flavobacteriales bacterium]MBK6882221.1 2-(1,2-epoxy-1,2-dihydrophenyl)acetyl-CoA isomerase [Flavobacteriales bacterium]MBK7481725.1 2-(1,2-epoxy-1,2-dihydrophenyl)acetyl-CoA isomerase [Flavobacteriales bacterium]MBK7618709.1 2-(1,2-epoxy-1,2-dihydrophenyl)acetyl-CoA isomerase [Flavobacteriales bacterium]
MDQNKTSYSVQDGVATITLNRPDKLNSFDREMALSTIEALDKAKADATVRAILLTGAGRAFCAGQDLVEAIAPGTRIEEIINEQYNPIVRRIRQMPKPVIAAVNGVAAGAGANIAYACDLTLAAESANFIQSFINIGLIPDSGGTYTLPRLVGMQQAFGQMILAPKVSAKEAEAKGMIWRCVPDADLMTDSNALALKLAQMPTKAIALTKEALNRGSQNDLDSQLDVENELQSQAGRSYDYNEGVKAFLEKRKPVYKGE